MRVFFGEVLLRCYGVTFAAHSRKWNTDEVLAANQRKSANWETQQCYVSTLGEWALFKLHQSSGIPLPQFFKQNDVTRS
jgi:hypothetical protein